MSTATRCYRCGREIDGAPMEVTVSKRGHRARFDLCRLCGDALSRLANGHFLEGERDWRRFQLKGEEDPLEGRDDG